MRLDFNELNADLYVCIKKQQWYSTNSDIIVGRVTFKNRTSKTITINGYKSKSGLINKTAITIPYNQIAESRFISMSDYLNIERLFHIQKKAKEKAREIVNFRK